MTPLEMLDYCRRKFGRPPRKFSWWQRLTYLHPVRPVWSRSPEEDLSQLFDNMSDLLRDGVVVWGCIIQANPLLFFPGSECHPGEIVFSLDHRGDVHSGFLVDVSKRISDLRKNMPDDPECKYIVDYLNDQRQRVFGLHVPVEVSPEAKCMISTTVFFREHLPGYKLPVLPTMPIIASPREPHVVIVLPSQFWPESLVSLAESLGKS